MRDDGHMTFVWLELTRLESYFLFRPRLTVIQVLLAASHANSEEARVEMRNGNLVKVLDFRSESDQPPRDRRMPFGCNSCKILKCPTS